MHCHNKYVFRNLWKYAYNNRTDFNYKFRCAKLSQHHISLQKTSGIFYKKLFFVIYDTYYSEQTELRPGFQFYSFFFFNAAYPLPKSPCTGFYNYSIIISIKLLECNILLFHAFIINKNRVVTYFFFIFNFAFNSFLDHLQYGTLIIRFKFLAFRTFNFILFTKRKFFFI